MMINVDPVCEKHETHGAHFAKDGAQQEKKKAKKKKNKVEKACVGLFFLDSFEFIL